MKLRPTIFLSGVSSEFRSFRDAVENEIKMKGCFAENQPNFHPDYRTVEAMLRQRLHEANAVIHIVGFRFGAEPKDLPPGKPRRSYSQMEFDIAREMEKPVYVFLSSDANVRDAASSDEPPEDAEAKALQLAHRQAVQNSNHLYYFFKSTYELSKLAAEIPQVVSFDFRADISRISKYAPAELIGRDEELKLLNDAWLKVRHAESPRARILTFVALGGEGKTSLVAKWAAELAFHNWPGCDAAFAWSFYSQGTREQYAASSDLFLKEAITFFGNDADKEFAASNAGAYEKGQRLARIVGERRGLLILDGLEPLQYAPTSPTPGDLKDNGIAALLRGLAAVSDGLCVVTTRYSLPNLKAFWQTTAPEIPLTRLSQKAGVNLLKSLGVNGSEKEFATLVEDVKGHALTLNLLGSYLHDAHAGDIRRRDLVKLEEANAEEQGGHAFRVMEAYEVAFENEGEKGKRALAILRLLGLFDRPVTADCLMALLEERAIPGLTDPLVGLSDAQRNLVLTRLADAKLLTVNREPSGALISLDAHPLLREYFAEELRSKHPQTWRAAHRRLYEYLFATTEDKPQPALEDLQPLFQAVMHGCLAGLQQEVFENLYYPRINRQNEFYSTNKLGAFASNLGALAFFFEIPWVRVSSTLREAYQAWLLNSLAVHLRALGRLNEALQPTQASLQIAIRKKDWSGAASRASNLSQLKLTLGKVSEAVDDGEQCVIYADLSGDMSHRITKRATHGAALHQARLRDDAKRRFLEAEQIQKEFQPKEPLLYSLQGFQYCEFLLEAVERVAWQRVLMFGELSGSDVSRGLNEIKEVARRTRLTLSWWTDHPDVWLIDIALDHLTLGRAALYEAVISETGGIANTVESILKTTEAAVENLRRSSLQDFIVGGLLARAWLRFLRGTRIGTESALEDLDEAWEIAERGPMRLHMADIHLYRARLFFREKLYPWESPQKDLEAAERLINECGYHRRDEELADAKRVILSA